jgi:hypothetical protein
MDGTRESGGHSAVGQSLKGSAVQSIATAAGNRAVPLLCPSIAKQEPEFSAAIEGVIPLHGSSIGFGDRRETGDFDEQAGRQ